MLQQFNRLIIYFAIILLCSCASYHTLLKPSQEQKTCKLSCQARMKQCSQRCHDNCPNCCVGANQRAIRHYDLYKHQQTVQGKIVALELKSYRDPLQCRKITCDCPADYRVCIQSCTGKIRKRLQVVPPC